MRRSSRLSAVPVLVGAIALLLGGGCSGETSAREAAPEPAGEARTGEGLARDLLEQWKRAHPESDWVAKEKERHTVMPPADNRDLLERAEGGEGHTYGRYTEKDLLVWARETEKLAVEGSRVFHSAELLGGTVGVSCDMCHPDAASTHPETYPKFQVQMGRVALLRDMINWCIQHPVRGQPLSADDPRMRALEAYLYAQRKGVPLNYGKH
jgi:hypothetical protein